MRLLARLLAGLLDFAPLWLLRRIPPGMRRLPEAPKPPIKFVDSEGVGWRERPDYMEPWQPDTGQHETWKREMRVAVLRWRRGERGQGNVNLAAYDLGERNVPVPMLFPLHMQLADACRRLGFSQLAECSVPDAPMTREEIERFWTEQETAAATEAELREARGRATASTWDTTSRGEFVYALAAEALPLLTVGPIDGAPTRHPRASLQPVNLTLESRDRNTYMQPKARK
jgi:hypothetical protein